MLKRSASIKSFLIKRITEVVEVRAGVGERRGMVASSSNRPESKGVVTGKGVYRRAPSKE